MGRMKVYELAKELNISSKEIITYLSKNGIEVASHSNALDEQAESLVRSRFQKTEAGKENTKTKQTDKEMADTTKNQTTQSQTDGKVQADNPAQNTGGRNQSQNPQGEQSGERRPSGEKKPQERPKKKSSISAVYNPQNSRMGGGDRRGGKRPPQNRNGKPPRRDNNGAEQQQPRQTGPIKPRADRQRRSERMHEEERDREAMRAQRAKEEQEKRLQEERLQEERPQQESAGRSQNERPNRPQGERPNRPQGERPNRPQGERPNRPQGERPNRPQNDRPNRPRPENGEAGYEKGEKTDRNNQKNVQGGRNYNTDRQGSRNNRQDGSGYSKESGKRVNSDGGRPNRDGSRPSGGNERRAKDSRDNSGTRDSGGGKNKGGRGNNRKNYDNQNSKNQERYVNLEKKTGHRKKNAQPAAPAEKKEEEIRNITLPEVMTVRELADILKIQASALIKKLFMQGEMLTVNSEIDYDKAEEIALEYNCIAEPEEKVDVIEELLREEEEDESTMVPRSPVVCVMGHVDHGKTSLLDAIRSTRVTDREAGGITQHIGASVVSINGQKITFLDTPGHEAFTAMRMRGANSTDIAILVVAADDGVMPQTVEAINHAKAAGIEIIVAVNKIDKPGADVDRVKQGMTEYDLIPEDWGGSTIFVPVSAKTKEGIDTLLEMVLLTAEMLELKANPNRNARGLVIEAQLDKGRGAVATVLVQKGTLHVGEPVAAGSCHGKIRAMIDDQGRRVREAGPSTPVEILGLDSVPNAGEVFVACDTEKDARAFAETFVAQNKEKLLEDTRHRMTLDDLFSQIQAGNVKELNLIVKADVQGSVEAVKQSLLKLSNDEVVVKVIHGGVGAINESDVILASASNAIIIGFNSKPDPIAKSTAEQEKVDIRLYNVIYNAIEDVQAAMKGMLDPIFEERVLGHAEIRQLFKASGVGTIAGSYVLDGTIERGSKIRISREGTQIYEGSLASLKRFKDDVKEVRAGYECGLVFEGFNDFQELDIVEAYKMVEVPRQ